MALQQRAAGILLPLSSLPGPYGIGNLGEDARRFIDFLARSGQTYWQVLPLHPVGYASSPYQCTSTFAGNPWYIDLNQLCQLGLLQSTECDAYPWGDDLQRVDYTLVQMGRERLLRQAYSRFQETEALMSFWHRQKIWLSDYAQYCVYKARNQGLPWWQWEEGCVRQDALTVPSEEMRYYVFLQYLFFRQWDALKAYANARGIRIIGDMPIYVAMDSADTWANRELFQLDDAGKPIAVAGCPPDAFSASGQLWGNPLYRWDIHEAQQYRWWIARLRHGLYLYDALRIDHFRGFESYYAVPAGEGTAIYGSWRPGPGIGFFNHVRQALGDANFIAEDLGFLTPEVHALLQECGYPGMRVLQFAFAPGQESFYLPHHHTQNSVVYPGTHDNDTTLGWIRNAPDAQIDFAQEYFAVRGEDALLQALLRATLASVAKTAMIPMQDYLQLGSEARINTPSTVGGSNWCWRMLPGQCTDALAEHILSVTHLYGRKCG